MSDRSLLFTDVSVLTALGIEQNDGFSFKDLSAGINLIYGPNGSGKSTTALVIQELLWPGNSGLSRPTVGGKFTIGTTVWSVRINAGHADIGSSEGTGTTPGLGPAEYRSRYMLALHQLINEKNTDFAKIIAAESQGGYDLEAAKISLGFKDRFRKDSKAIQQEKSECKKVEAAISIQRQIEAENRRLPELNNEHRKAKEAEKKFLVLEEALAFKGVESKHRELKIEKRKFSEGVALLNGDERTRLDKLAAEQTAAERSIDDAKADLGKTARQLENLNLSGDQVHENIIPAIRGLQTDLLSLEKDIDAQQRVILKAQSEKDTARARIGDHVTHTQLDALNKIEVEDLSSFSRDSAGVQADEIVLNKKKRFLSEQISETVQNLEINQIREGISSIKHWLETPEPAGTNGADSQKPLLLTSALIALLSLILAVVYTPLWSILFLAAAGLLFLGKTSGSTVKESDSRAVYQASYRKTSLPEPDSWETNSLLDLLRSLITLAELRIREDNRIKELRRLEPDEAALEERKNALSTQRNNLDEKLGFSTDVDHQWLPLLVQNIMQWQQSSTSLATAHNELNRLVLRQAKSRSETNGIIHRYGYEYRETVSAAQVAGVIDDLNLKFSNYRTAIQAGDSAGLQIITAETALGRISLDKQDIFDQLNLDPSRESLIDNWLVERPDYLILQKELLKQEARIVNYIESFKTAGNENLLKLDTFELEELIENTKRQAEKREELLEEINKIQFSNENALSGHDLSDAMRDKDAAVAVLEDLRDRNSRATAGEMLVEWVQKVAVDRARPLVFSRARELVSEFTRGQLELVIDDRVNPPRFMACVSGRLAQPVEKLSIGERVQVLIAIRTAFLELNEPVRLPLLLDEALGTSDDLRAGLIIDAVIRIARSGRQVFYFTAQHDEIGKWLSKLESTGTEHRMFDLGKIRNKGAADSFPLRLPDPDQRLAAASPVQPHGMTRDEYGRALGVPGINPLEENLDRLHLWHLVNDNTLLYGLLKLNIEKWGQFKTLVKYGGRKLFTGSAIQFDAIYAAAAAVENGCKFWRAGRGLKVDRRVLMDSNCVSKVFIDRITNLAEGLGGNAAEIITGLRNKKIQRWPSSKTEELQDYFEEHGYTSTETVLSPEEIRVHVLAALAEELNSNLIRPDYLDEIINSLPR
ncbi:MAG: hypothetical protein KAH31_01390 [Candidatus Sabulitectum sp.]|nr:hypothetical protein [Candidatus Sabulitectum sp.]